MTIRKEIEVLYRKDGEYDYYTDSRQLETPENKKLAAERVLELIKTDGIAWAGILTQEYKKKR